MGVQSTYYFFPFFFFAGYQTWLQALSKDIRKSKPVRATTLYLSSYPYCHVFRFPGRFPTAW